MTPLERFLVINVIAAAGVLAAVASLWLPRRLGLAAIFATLPVVGIALGQAFC